MPAQRPQRSGKSATADGSISRHQYTDTSSQISALQRLHGNRQALTHREACAQLQALGFEHTDKVPVSGEGRIPARGKGLSNRDAAVRWPDDMQVLHWIDFRTGDKGTIFADAVKPISPFDQAKQRREAEQAKKKAAVERQRHQTKAAGLAQSIWNSGADIGTHQYVKRKGLSGLHNARIDVQNSSLLIPMYVSGIGLVNLQRITTNGRKLFVKDARVNGAFSALGNLKEADRVLVCEGWATGAALYEQLQTPVVIASSAGNLLAVSEALRLARPDAIIVIAGDDDRQGELNAGRAKAIEAAEAIDTELSFPEFCKRCTCSDHNDVMLCSRRRLHG